MRLLVVDDEPDMRQMLEFHLREEGFEVQTAGDGVSAIAALDAGPFDLAVLDLHLPRMSGPEVLAIVRRRWPDLAVVTCSSSMIAAKDDGSAVADGHLQKPFELDDLLDTVIAALDLTRRAQLARAR